MPSVIRDRWTSFQEIFRTVQSEGIAETVAAAALLSALSSTLTAAPARGLRRQWDRIGGEKPERERLPRETMPANVPAAYWRKFVEVNNSCESFWQDNVEPDSISSVEYSRVDWISGTSEQQGWLPESNWDILRTAWSVLEIPATTADALISGLCGRQTTKAKNSEGEIARFMSGAIREGQSQRSAVRLYRDIYGSGKRDDLAAIYSKTHEEILGYRPRRGAPKKIPR